MTDFNKMQWESGFFGFPVATIINHNGPELKSILKQLSLLDYKLAFLFSSEKDVELQQYAAKNGGLLVDRKVTYKRSVPIQIIPDKQSENHGKSIRINPSHIQAEELFDLAYSAGHYSRFKADQNFRKNDFKRLYSQWVINSLNGQLADYTIVVYGAEGIEGFSTLKLTNNIAKIGLISVDASKQNQGIGKSLIQESFRICVEKMVSTIEVVTQMDNSEACLFYEKVGFSILSIHYVYHFWL
jgi:dTDP-4-amino-4,6-dideoxy-D-galactose acyltransferase